MTLYRRAADAYFDIYHGYQEFRTESIRRILAGVEQSVRERRFRVGRNLGPGGSIVIMTDNIPAGAADITLFASLGSTVTLQSSGPQTVVASVDITAFPDLARIAVHALAPLRQSVLTICADAARIGKCREVDGGSARGGGEGARGGGAGGEGAKWSSERREGGRCLEFDIATSDLHTIPNHFRERLAVKLAFIDDDHIHVPNTDTPLTLAAATTITLRIDLHREAEAQETHEEEHPEGEHQTKARTAGGAPSAVKEPAAGAKTLDEEEEEADVAPPPPKKTSTAAAKRGTKRAPTPDKEDA